jgi:hypothetical protein
VRFLLCISFESGRNCGNYLRLDFIADRDLDIIV